MNFSMLFLKTILFLIISCISLTCVEAELITLSLVGAALMAAGGWYKWDAVKDNSICQFKECCNSKYVPYDMDKLRKSLSEHMFGQPLVNELRHILNAHKEAYFKQNRSNKKALAISFHGWPGVGKNYATTMIAEAIFKKGMDSKYVAVFMGDKDFGCEDEKEKKKEIVAKVFSIVKECPAALIIFDEVHEMCPTILEVLKPMMSHHREVDGVNFRDSIFLFISNIAGGEIATTLLDLYSQRIMRNNVDFHNFELVIRQAAFSTGGLRNAILRKHLIDHYIPFLPLERDHVEQCARVELRAHGVFNPSEAMIADAMSVVTFGPTDDKPIFANNGCKRLTKHIPYVVQKHKK